MEKPLHVRVAEALGWIECEPFEADGIYDYENWIGDDSTRPNEKLIGGYEHGAIPRFDTDWSATGPLIEKYRLHVEPDECHEPLWLAYRIDGEVFEAQASTPLVAICHLILALAKAGKLEKSNP